MKLWTIQHEEAYQVMEKTGRLIASEEHIFSCEGFLPAYRWIAEQMKNKICYKQMVFIC